MFALVLLISCIMGVCPWSVFWIAVLAKIVYLTVIDDW